ncbi:kynurenine/alpha-aminoadipate aminotransferase, mitochondrial-like [Planococcus citri]|uniref:kynurenine/alpha-aminoadipate aminotransferase, mitochondrial-like n=1 Tax=Planococcus citri TaxID=170843 RepID=UPI0031F740CF
MEMEILNDNYYAPMDKHCPKIDFSYFFNSSIKLRGDNYLKHIGDLAFNAGSNAAKFSNGDPNPECSPYQGVTVHLKNGQSFQINGKVLDDALSYMTIKGYRPFIDLLKDYQDELHGKQNWNVKGITTTSGSQAALYQIVEMCVSPGDPVLVQSPLYPGVLSILQHLQVEYLEVESDEYGVSARHLETILFDRKVKGFLMPKVFYLNPTGTNPTGGIVPLNRKIEIYKICSHFNVLILEDDPYFLLTYKDEIPSSFLSLDIENRVVRFDSFSKTLGAGFRVGYVTAAEEIIEKLNLIKGSSAMASPFTQVILHYTLESMKFEGFLQHMRYISGFYRKNCEKVLNSLDKYMHGLATWNVPEGAMFVWLTINDIDHISDEFIQKCIENLVFICPGFVFYGKERQSPCIRLAFSTVNENQIEQGIKVLSYLIREELMKNCPNWT